jgi:hypothetical protein
VPSLAILRRAPLATIILLVSAGALAAVILVLGSAASNVPSTEDPPTQLVFDLAEQGLEFRAATVSEESQASVTSQEAVDVATGEYGGARNPVSVYLGRLTQRGSLEQPPADATPAAGSPSGPNQTWPVANRLAYAVVIQGLSIAPNYGPVTQERTHSELVVFIDADTGAELLAITYR